MQKGQHNANLNQCRVNSLESMPSEQPCLVSLIDSGGKWVDE